jgi:hypothetical protein
MIQNDFSQPDLRRLPAAEPTQPRADRLRARCRAVLAHRRRRRAIDVVESAVAAVFAVAYLAVVLVEVAAVYAK